MCVSTDSTMIAPPKKTSDFLNRTFHGCSTRGWMRHGNTKIYLDTLCSGLQRATERRPRGGKGRHILGDAAERRVLRKRCTSFFLPRFLNLEASDLSYQKLIWRKIQNCYDTGWKIPWPRCTARIMQKQNGLFFRRFWGSHSETISAKNKYTLIWRIPEDFEG